MEPSAFRGPDAAAGLLYWIREDGAETRSILHVDLDPFVVSVERSLDPSLRGRPLIIGSGAGDDSGVVAAASSEARAAGVRPGQSLAVARRRCPEAALRSGDLETYARISDEVTQILLQASRRVERPSADEAYVDLTRDGVTSPAPGHRRGDDQGRAAAPAGAGRVAGPRLFAAGRARRFHPGARPRGLLVVLPGYEASYLARQPVSFLPDLPPHLEAALEAAGLKTLGDLAGASTRLRSAGPSARPPRTGCSRRRAARARRPFPSPPRPTRLAEETLVRDRRSDAAALLDVWKAWPAAPPAGCVPSSSPPGRSSSRSTRPDGVTRREDAFEPRRRRRGNAAVRGARPRRPPARRRRRACARSRCG